MERENEPRFKIYELFGKSEQSVNQDVEIVKKWIKNQPYLPEVMEDTKIRNFLVLNEFNIDETKKKIHKYYTIKDTIPEFFENSNPKLSNVKTAFENMYMCVHPKLVDGIYRVYFYKAKKPNTLDNFEAAKVWFDIFEVKLYDECVAGDIIICDMSTMTLKDIDKFTVKILTDFWTVYKEVYSIRLKTFYILNSPPYVDVFLNRVKATTFSEIFEKFKICSDTAILKEIFDQKTLPKDYGGGGPSLEQMNERMQKELAQYQHRFDKLDTLRLRPGKK